MTDDESIEINPKDLRIDTYRSTGAGGQHVNTTDSAVRIMHIPTGVTVQYQNERSQIKNRETAMKMLTAKLMQIADEEKREKIEDIQGKYSQIAWGQQIRSYVFHPYSMVKDHRTGCENGKCSKSSRWRNRRIYRCIFKSKHEKINGTQYLSVVLYYLK